MNFLTKCIMANPDFLNTAKAGLLSLSRSIIASIWM